MEQTLRSCTQCQIMIFVTFTSITSSVLLLPQIQIIRFRSHLLIFYNTTIIPVHKHVIQIVKINYLNVISLRIKETLKKDGLVHLMLLLSTHRLM